jgi:hypothetical protein
MQFDQDRRFAPLLGPKNRRLVTALAAVACCALVGCGSVKLHSGVRQKQGEDAKKAWAEVDLKAFFDAERANLAKVLVEEVNSTRRLAAVNRETEIHILARKKVSELPSYFDAELSKLVKPDAGKTFRDDEVEGLVRLAASAWTNLAEERRLLSEVERSTSFLQSLGAPAFTCAQLLATPPKAVDAWKKANPVVAQAANRRIQTTSDLCGDVETQRSEFATNVRSLAGSDSTLAAYVRDWDRAKLSMVAREKETSEAQAAFAEASQQFNDETAKAAPGLPPSAKAKELAEKLAKLLIHAESAQEVLGKEWASQERIDRINSLLASLQAGTTLDSDTASKAEVVASMLPTIANDARQVAEARKGAHLVSVLIQRDVEQGNLNVAKVLAAIQKKDLAIREAIVRAALDQSFTYLRARRQIGWVVACAPEAEVGSSAACGSGKKDAAVHAAWDTYQPQARRNILEATTLYLDAFSRQQANIRAMMTEYLALSRARTVAVSEVNAGIWVSLIGASVSQAADFAALGLKVEDIEKVLNLLGIFYIGHGVNK